MFVKDETAHFHEICKFPLILNPQWFYKENIDTPTYIYALVT